MKEQKQLSPTEIRIQEILDRTTREAEKINVDIIKLSVPAPQLNPPDVPKKDQAQIVKDTEKLHDNINQLKKNAIKEIDNLSKELPETEKQKVRQEARKSLGIDKDEQQSFSSRFMRDRVSKNDNVPSTEKVKEEYVASSSFIQSMSTSKYFSTKEAGPSVSKNQGIGISKE